MLYLNGSVKYYYQKKEIKHNFLKLWNVILKTKKEDKYLEYKFPDGGLELQPGLYKLQGSNGAGKTTLFKILTMRAKPFLSSSSEFTYKINNTSIDLFRIWNFSQLNIKQNFKFSFFSYMEQFQYIPPAISNKDIEYLKEISIEQDIKENGCSGGQQQERIRNIFLKKGKKIYFLDEPFNNLDPEKIKELAIDISKFVSSNPECLIVFTNHNNQDFENDDKDPMEIKVENQYEEKISDKNTSLFLIKKQVLNYEK